MFESDGKNISENKKKIGRKLGVIFLIAGGIGFLLFGNMYSNFYGENRVYLQVLSLIGLADAIVGIFLIVKRKDNVGFNMDLEYKICLVCSKYKSSSCGG